MAMMIQKFHRLIQSKVVWTAFLVLVCIAFVGLYIPGMDTYEQNLEAAAAGELYGKPVAQEDFQHHYINVYLRYTLRQLNPPRITDELDDVFRQMAWRRLVTMRKAEEMGVRAGDAEVVQRIKMDPTFQQDGAYNQARYNAFVQQFLPRIGITETQYEQHIREEMTLNKMRFLAAQSALISPAELRERYAMLRDKFVVEYAVLTEDLVAADVSVSPEEVETFFHGDPEPFRVPEQVRVSMVQFDVDEHLDEVDPPTDKEAREFYAENRNSFEYLAPAPPRSKEGPGTAQEAEEPPAADATGGEEGEEDSEDVETAGDAPPVLQTQPFEEVRDTILAAMVKHRARVLASEAATDFAVQATPLGNPNAPTFEEVAEQFQRKIIPLDPLTETNPVPGLSAGLRFNRAAFGLDAEDPDQNVSDPVLSENAVYVLRLEERIASHLPEFGDVATRVADAARAKAVEDALLEKAREVKASAEKALAGGKGFGETLNTFGLETKRTEPFSASTGLLSVEHANVIVSEIMALNAGEVTPPVEVPDGLLVAYVASREDADPTDFATVRNQIANTLRRRQAENLYEQWQEALLQEADFRDRREKPPAPEEDVPEGSASNIR